MTNFMLMGLITTGIVSSSAQAACTNGSLDLGKRLKVTKEFTLSKNWALFFRDGETRSVVGGVLGTVVSSHCKLMRDNDDKTAFGKEVVFPRGANLEVISANDKSYTYKLRSDVLVDGRKGVHEFILSCNSGYGSLFSFDQSNVCYQISKYVDGVSPESETGNTSVNNNRQKQLPPQGIQMGSERIQETRSIPAK